MVRIRFVVLAALLFGLLFNAAMPAHAQEGGGLSISTTYPSMVVGIGETVTLSMDVRSSISQKVDLSVSNLPAGWTAEFRGGGRVINSVYVTEGNSSKVELRVATPKTVAAGRYEFVVTAQGQNERAEFPLAFTVKEKAPARLTFETDFPTIRGGSESAFNFSVTLKNEGDDDLSVSLLADAPRELAVTFKSAGKDITNLPTDVKAGSSVKVDITATPLTSLPVGTYPFTVTAQSDTVTAAIELTAEVVGQPQLSITTPDGRLSGTAYINRDNQIKLVLRNSGNSPAAGVKLTVSAPAGWTVTLDPETVVEVPAGGEVEVTANVKPSDKAISGDYVVTFRAQPNQSASKSADFRITVQTSTLWGAVGIALIAVAVAIVGMAVSRFGRR
ncbi:MAG: NEW3 domain-containing protein [Anaerolineales bacterium]